MNFLKFGKMVFLNILNIDSLVTEQNFKKSIFLQHPDVH